MMLSVQDLPAQESGANVERLTRLLDMAFWHNQAGNTDAAIKASEAALVINSRSTTAHSLLGSLYEKKGLDELAIEHFEAVLSLNPDSPADSQKLDQLRRGVHVRAVTSPAAHLWLPPGLVKVAPRVQKVWATLTESDSKGEAGLPRKPLVAAGAAFLLILAFGLLLTRPWAKAETVTTYPITTATALTPAVSVDHSAYAGGASVVDPGGVKPMVLAGSASSVPFSYPAPALTMHDPFVGVAPAAPRNAESPTWYLPPVPRQRRLAHRQLPILPMGVTPIPDVAVSDLAPVPVAAPNSSTPIATVAAIPQHVVVVNSLGYGTVPPLQSTDNVAVLPSHISITVHSLKTADSYPVAASASDDKGDDSAKGGTFQQRALALQQQGDYGQARRLYQGAIRAYEAQIASGQGVETAQRGLAASQIGLQICQQSQ